jgi:hypothetical protein
MMEAAEDEQFASREDKQSETKPELPRQKWELRTRKANPSRRVRESGKPLAGLLRCRPGVYRRGSSAFHGSLCDLLQHPSQPASRGAPACELQACSCDPATANRRFSCALSSPSTCASRGWEGPRLSDRQDSCSCQRPKRAAALPAGKENVPDVSLWHCICLGLV